MLPPLPRCSSWTYSSLVSPSRISLPRKGCRVGLHIVLFEVCSAFTRVAACTLARPPIRGPLYRRLQPFRHLHDCSGCFRLERVAGWAFHPLERAAFHGAHPKPDISAVQSGRSAKPGGCGSVCFRPIVKPHRNRSWNKRPSAGLSASFKPASKLGNRSPSAPSEQTEVDRR